MDELAGLAVGRRGPRSSGPSSRTVPGRASGAFLGKGKVEEVHELRKELGADLVIFDHDLTPIQQRNLEDEIGVGSSTGPSSSWTSSAQRARIERRQAPGRDGPALLSPPPPHGQGRRHVPSRGRHPDEGARANRSSRKNAGGSTTGSRSPEGHPGHPEKAGRPAGEPPEEPRAHGLAGRVYERREIHSVQHADPGEAVHVAQPLRDPRPAPAPCLLPGRPPFLPLGHGRLHPEAPGRAGDIVPGHPGRGPRGRRRLPHHRRDEPSRPGTGRGRRRPSWPGSASGTSRCSGSSTRSTSWPEAERADLLRRNGAPEARTLYLSALTGKGSGT